jgi:hypothetical protein
VNSSPFRQDERDLVRTNKPSGKNQDGKLVMIRYHLLYHSRPRLTTKANPELEKIASENGENSSFRSL